MRVITEVEMWRSGAMLCVLILHEGPDGLIVQVRRQQKVVVSVWCTDPDAAATEAEHWYARLVATTGDCENGRWFELRDRLRAQLKRSARPAHDEESQ